jgi:hypothetical protein
LPASVIENGSGFGDDPKPHHELHGLGEITANKGSAAARDVDQFIIIRKKPPLV